MFIRNKKPPPLGGDKMPGCSKEAFERRRPRLIYMLNPVIWHMYVQIAQLMYNVREYGVRSASGDAMQTYYIGPNNIHTCPIHTFGVGTGEKPEWGRVSRRGIKTGISSTEDSLRADKGALISAPSGAGTERVHK